MKLRGVVLSMLLVGGGLVVPVQAQEDEDALLQDFVDLVERAPKEEVRKAAEQGDASAQLMLGLMYYNGIGVTQDLFEAAFWLRRAAEQGDA